MKYHPYKPMKIISLLTAVAIGLSGCSGQTAKTVKPSPTVAAAVPSVQPSTASLSQANTFEAALNKASDAAYTAKTAETKEDWELTAVRWQQAVELIKAVPKGNANYTVAQAKLVNYQKNLTTAQSRSKQTISAASSPPSSLSTVSATASTSVSVGNVKTAASKSTVVSIEDFFETYMDAVVNRGTSGTEYWCSQSEEFQSSFFSPRGWRLLNTHKAPNGSGGSFTIQLDSSNKGGSQITANWVVVVEKEKNRAKAKTLPGGWCVTMLWDK